MSIYTRWDFLGIGKTNLFGYNTEMRTLLRYAFFDDMNYHSLNFSMSRGEAIVI